MRVIAALAGYRARRARQRDSGRQARVSSTRAESVIAAHAGYWLQRARLRDSGRQVRVIASQAGYWARVHATPGWQPPRQRERQLPLACASARQAVGLVGLAQVLGMLPCKPRVKKTPPGMAAQTRPALAVA